MKYLVQLVAFILAFPVLGQTVGEAQEITCRTETGQELVIQLWTPHPLGDPMHCIQSERLPSEAFCAPNGGWGLLNDAGVPALVSVTMDWKTAHEHQLGKLTAIAGPKAVRFNAQHGVGTGSNLSYEWKFTLDRRTGDATWFSKAGERVPYRCELQG
ncbi:hypothetical protein GCM10016455_12530 [Aliiroseovarius zhejiangensis]|uniref:DUF3617 family protein n=1 Tax=Aliiroseovarius zhejiangensis TaxID=1632025 RepID=A0ABQ3ITB0_9RHOB|nr:hypothetical protein [Aliiroseovarius zhejiangensis]GHE93831.1 hypothetical protein GCM10016455_12530 [Aliiroseovarius zhejiangensis]